MDLKKTADWLERNGYPKFRLRQISDAVYKQAISNFDEITALPARLRDGLKALEDKGDTLDWETFKREHLGL